MSNPFLPEGQHYALIEGIDILSMSEVMHTIGNTLGDSTVEHGLIGFGDPLPTRIHSELIYHEDLLPYFMLGCIQKATKGGENIIYDAVKAADIISTEQPELLGVTMIYHAEHYKDTKAEVPLIRHKKGENFLAFRQKKYALNEVKRLPKEWSEDEFYAYIDGVIAQSVELDHLLEPGQILIVDNYKTLHVRTAFEGLRKVIRVRVDDPESHKRYIV